MTTLGAWISYPKTRRTPSALYLVSDSRISWKTPSRRWDAGRKLFAPISEPHLFGYCGDVVFPALVLAQITSAIDQNIIFSNASTVTSQHEIIFNSIQKSFSRRHNAPDEDFWILHAARVSPWPTPAFALWVIHYSVEGKVWEDTEIPMPSETKSLISLGTGGPSAKIHVRRWQQSDTGGTSRSIFCAFHDAIKSGDDPLSGGPPQIAALYLNGPPQTIGFIEKGTHYLHGLELMPRPTLRNIEWRDSLFQRINPRTMRVLKGARRFARPRGV